MSAYLLCGDAMVRAPSARIARGDVRPLRDSAELLEQARVLREDSQAEVEAARAAGYERGRADAIDEMRAALGEALEHLSAQFAAENARRERSVADAAFQVVEQLIGMRDGIDTISGLASQALEKSGAQAGPVVVQVHEQWAEPLAERFAEHASCRIEGSAALDRFACRVVSPEGRIIADLETQLSTLRDRWGLNDGGSDG